MAEPAQRQLQVLLFDMVREDHPHKAPRLLFHKRGELLMEESMARGIADLWRFIPVANLAAPTEE